MMEAGLGMEEKARRGADMAQQDSEMALIDAYLQMKAIVSSLTRALLAYEEWEADLLFTQESWSSSLPRFTPELWSSFLEVQAQRNEALKLVIGEVDA